MINPYNFVRAGEPMPRKQVRDLASISGRSGWIDCRLTALTPLFTRGEQRVTPGGGPVSKFFRLGGEPAIPASSLKGMLRVHAEAIANGCGPFSNDRHHPPCPAPRADGDLQLCPVCRVFGYLEREHVFPGRIRPYDARVEPGYRLSERPIVLRELGTPKPSHRPFYEPGERVRGRKFYYHADRNVDDVREVRTPSHRNAVIEPLLHGSFVFRIGFVDLDDVELGLLLHTLELSKDEPELFHKFGMGKPLGMGTVRIDVIGAEEFPAPGQRYRRYDTAGIRLEPERVEEAQRPETEGRLRAWVAQAQRAYTQEYARALGIRPPGRLWDIPEPNLEDLKVILSRVPYEAEIEYPSYSWFKDRNNARERLPGIQDVHVRGERLPH